MKNADDDSEKAELAEVDARVVKFPIAESNVNIESKLQDSLNQKIVKATDLNFKRVNGNKSFTYDQVKNIDLKTNFSIESVEIKDSEDKFVMLLRPVSGDYKIEVQGKYFIGRNVPVLTRNIYKGNQITQEDIALKSFSDVEVGESVVHDVSDIIGKTASRNLMKDKTISKDDIKNAIVIAKNSSVTALYRSGSVEIKALAVALDEGSTGDIIRLKNFDSGKTFKAVVQEDGTVIIAVAPSAPDNASSNSEFNNENQAIN